MKTLTKKINFLIIIKVERCNPNGDPLGVGSAPRQDMDGYGWISDVCLKRKIRNRMYYEGNDILVVNDTIAGIGSSILGSMKENHRDIYDLTSKKDADKEELYKKACERWIDVRSFGSVMTYKGKGESSIGIRGPVSIGQATSIEPVEIVNAMITKSTNNEEGLRGKGSDTMGVKSFVKRGVYTAFGGITRQLASLTGFTDDDAELIKKCLIDIFEDDESAARPAGSMQVCDILWWEQPSIDGKKIYSPKRLMEQYKVAPSDVSPYYTLEKTSDIDIEPEFLV